jgi:uncharacterized protein YdiU (UPF0061 family)
MTNSTSAWNLEQSYFNLPDFFYSRQAPTIVSAPRLVIYNQALASELGIPTETNSDEKLAALFSGNELPKGAVPFAQAYAGHQFAHFTRLGDGRAIMLGEQIDPSGKRWDVHFKGSGVTAYSRRGDGRAALGPMLREYLISEAMHAFRIPTTRSLAVVATGETVYRETSLPGAVLTRVASSHIRVGTFEFALAFHGVEAVRALADYAIERHYPSLKNAQEPYVEFLREVLKRQATLIAEWMLVGFVHGVMNTDNMLISGETIDYGPCAFMDVYDPATVFSSIDRNGRYAYGNQPSIGLWNLTRLAETLLPLLGTDQGAAIETMEKVLNEYWPHFSMRWLTGMVAKLGLSKPLVGDQLLIEELLQAMKEKKLDFTNTFVSLTREEPRSIGLAEEWISRWEKRRQTQELSHEDSRALMLKSNPRVIPRNHLVEAALESIAVHNDLNPFHELLSIIQKPFTGESIPLRFTEAAPVGSSPYHTFCGT